MSDDDIIAFAQAVDEPEAAMETDLETDEGELQIVMPSLADVTEQLRGISLFMSENPIFSAADQMYISRLSSKTARLCVSRLQSRQQQSITQYFSAMSA